MTLFKTFYLSHSVKSISLSLKIFPLQFRYQLIRSKFSGNFNLLNKKSRDQNCSEDIISKKHKTIQPNSQNIESVFQ